MIAFRPQPRAPKRVATAENDKFAEMPVLSPGCSATHGKSPEFAPVHVCHTATESTPTSGIASVAGQSADVLD